MYEKHERMRRDDYLVCDCHALTKLTPRKTNQGLVTECDEILYKYTL